MSFIKVTTAAVAVAMFATAAGAGSLIEPQQEPMIEAVEEESNSAGILLPLAGLLLIAAAVGGGSDASTVEE